MALGAGATNVDPNVTPRSVTRGTLAVLFIIGVHYEDHDLQGSSFSVQGDDCSGGWLNVSSNWNDRVSSTKQRVPNDSALGKR